MKQETPQQEQDEPIACEGVPFGTQTSSLDSRKRMTVPSLWRSLVGNPQYLYVIKNPADPCVTLLPPEEMTLKIRKLREGSMFNKARAAALRHISVNSEIVPMDSQGRIRICDRLMASIGLKTKATFIGMGLGMEVWATENRPENEEPNPEQLEAAFDELGF